VDEGRRLAEDYEKLLFFFEKAKRREFDIAERSRLKESKCWRDEQGRRCECVLGTRRPKGKGSARGDGGYGDAEMTTDTGILGDAVTAPNT